MNGSGRHVETGLHAMWRSGDKRIKHNNVSLLRSGYPNFIAVITSSSHKE